MSNGQLPIDTTNITAKVYAESDKGVMYAKVSIPSIGMYINSISISPSPKFPEKGLWLQWPRFHIGGGRWKFPVEWNGSSPLKSVLEDAIWRAVEEWQHEKLEPPMDLEIPNFDSVSPP